eukprot:329889-Pyramimonas_sp.AAC.1
MDRAMPTHLLPKARPEATTLWRDESMNVARSLLWSVPSFPSRPLRSAMLVEVVASDATPINSCKLTR